MSIELFKTVASMDTQVLKRTLAKTLEKAGYEPVETNDYLYGIGDIPVCLVAHLDTVFAAPPHTFFYDQEKEVIWSPDGLGADDRAGVYAILRVIQSGRRPHILFTMEEEKGGLGALMLAAKGNPFIDVNYFIELDRRNGNDCVFYHCLNEEFRQFVESFGFKTARGIFSDISILCPEWGIAGVNLSVGYYNEHTLGEYLCMDELYNTIERVNAMLDANNNQKYIYGESDISYVLHCDKCGTSMSSIIATPIYDGENIYDYCPDCVAKYVSWCSNCGSLYPTNTELPHRKNMCPECYKEILKRA